MGISRALCTSPFTPFPHQSIPTNPIPQTRPATSTIDGVGILATLPTPQGPSLILQKQFRPPIGKVVIEIPAGLVDDGESAGGSAVRELREETGYVGTVREGGVGVVMFNGKFVVVVCVCERGRGVGDIRQSGGIRTLPPFFLPIKIENS